MDLFSIQQQNTNNQFTIHEDSFEELKVESIWNDDVPVSSESVSKSMTLWEREQLRQLNNDKYNTLNLKSRDDTLQEQVINGVYTMQLWELCSNSLMGTEIETGNINRDDACICNDDELDTHFTRLVLFIGSQCRLRLLVDKFNFVNMNSRDVSIIDGDFNGFENDERITLNFVRINMLADEWALEVLGPSHLQNVILLFEKVASTVIDLFGKINVVLSDAETLGNDVMKSSWFHGNIPGNLFTILETTFKYLNVETLIEESIQSKRTFAESFNCYKPPSSTISIVLKENLVPNFELDGQQRIYHTKYEHGDYRKIIKVKHEHVKYLLACKGARITRIRKKTKVHIKVLDDDKENGFQGDINGWHVGKIGNMGVSYQSICLTGEEKEVKVVEKMLLSEITSGARRYIQ
ncbi:unnamed protein product [Ambrosiozyma monospora]|uniref:Unnamed protein product n=1 Tax=Ambrosiozyma monospora TaxID=43982 RepID=A0ACB5ST81_AMBMO|nr:unnamed protein product [Ambrosiozyma monospora]